MGRADFFWFCPCLYYTGIFTAVNVPAVKFPPTDSCQRDVPQNKSLTGNVSDPSPDGGPSISS